MANSARYVQSLTLYTNVSRSFTPLSQEITVMLAMFCSTLWRTRYLIGEHRRFCYSETTIFIKKELKNSLSYSYKIYLKSQTSLHNIR